MFLIFSGPVGIFLVLLLLMLQERPERYVSKLPRNIRPAKNHMHEWEAEMIRARKSSTLQSRKN